MSFIEADFPPSKWTKKRYERLMNTFGHIAHTNQHGFWDNQFSSLPRKLRFLQQLVEWNMGGDPLWTYSDVEKAVRGQLIAHGIVLKYERLAEEEKQSLELALRDKLVAKYGPGPATPGKTNSSGSPG